MPYLVLKFRIICYPFTGGFYSDNLGHVAENCKKCPNGSFVAYDKAPGTRAQDCKSCPHGKKNIFTAISTNLYEIYIIYSVNFCTHFEVQRYIHSSGWKHVADAVEYNRLSHTRRATCVKLV